MSAAKTAIIVARILNQIYKFMPNVNPRQMKYKQDQMANQMLAKLLKTDEEKKAFINTILTMTLLTSGAVDFVRDPELWSPEKSVNKDGVKRRWSHILSHGSEKALDVLRFPTYELVTKEQYQLANKLLPMVGSTVISSSEVMEAFTKADVGSINSDFKDRMVSDEKYLGSEKVLYRGLHSMPASVVKFLANPGASWDMSRGVSTSYDYNSAEGFMNKGGNGIILHMKNETGRGFTADALSKYKPEREVILSGKIIVEDFTLTMYAGEEFDPNIGFDDELIKIECNKSFILMRKGLKVIYGKRNVDFNSEIKPMLDALLSEQSFEFESKGKTYKIKMLDKSATLKVTATIS